MNRIYTSRSSLGRQNMIPGEFSEECCPSPPFTERNTPRELNSTLGIAGLANVRKHGGEKKDYQLNKLNKNKKKSSVFAVFFCNGSFIHAFKKDLL